LTDPPFGRRRTVYAFIDRQNLPGVLRVFDMANPDQHSPQRYSTTIPQQALYLMNNPFVVEQARALASRADVEAIATPAGRIERLHRLAYQRGATPEQVGLGLEFLEAARTDAPSEGASSQLTPWQQYCQALLLANEFVFVD
jgi:hypothetical protein